MNSSFKISKYSKLRNLIADTADAGRRNNLIHGFGEFNITKVRPLLKQAKDSAGNSIPLISYLAFCFAKAVSQNIKYNSFRKGSSKIITFDEVDLSLIFEKELKREKIPLNYVIRNAGSKSLLQVNEEVNRVKSSPLEDNFMDGAIKFFYNLPKFIRRLIWRIILARPLMIKKYLGTIGMTALHTVNTGTLWGLPLSPLNISITVGSVIKKPAIHNGSITEDDYVTITISLNHDMFDGVEGKRFLKCFKEITESGEYINSQAGL